MAVPASGHDDEFDSEHESGHNNRADESERSSLTDSSSSDGRKTIQWGSALQVGLGAFALLNIWLAAALMAVFGVMGLVVQSSSPSELLAIFLVAGSLAGSGALLLPSIYHGLMRLMNRPAVDSLALLRRLRPGMWVVAFPLLLAAGYAVLQVPAITWLLLPPLHLLTVGVPVAWMLHLGVRDLPLGTPQRAWGVFTSGLLLGPFLISIIEMAAMVVVVLLAAVYIASDAQLTREVMGLVRLFQAGQPTQDELTQVLAPYLARPGVIFSVLAFGSLIVPLTEEALKSIGVWLLVGRRMTPQAGFAAGALSGAGYAFMESLLLTSNGQEWVSLMVARIGTSALHILTTAMIGWALVNAWQRGRYLRLGATYLGMVGLHGLWNGLTLYTAFQSLSQTQGNPSPSSIPAGLPNSIAPVLLLGLAILSLVWLITANRLLAANKLANSRLPTHGPAASQPVSGEVGSEVIEPAEPTEAADAADSDQGPVEVFEEQEK